MGILKIRQSNQVPKLSKSSEPKQTNMINGKSRTISFTTKGEKVSPIAMPISHWPVNRPATGACKLNPSTHNNATTKSGPSIHGRGKFK